MSAHKFEAPTSWTWFLTSQTRRSQANARTSERANVMDRVSNITNTAELGESDISRMPTSWTGFLTLQTRRNRTYACAMHAGA
ncbi:hypothetical protein AMTR_s00104p00072960 [Amborella trichopoda]|uniref:Uncharacterized protein n=1 Tax=Amborella trichopoda TaxID=13333 RepID=W1P076_AMBTC|nr:hypothetical protein AMTR_s00104p00072960 [Amborella trichopoda]